MKCVLDEPAEELREGVYAIRGEHNAGRRGDFAGRGRPALVPRETMIASL